MVAEFRSSWQMPTDDLEFFDLLLNWERQLPTHQRIGGLDGLRGIAALAVLAYHFEALALGSSDAPRLARFGFLGVELFFVISGFVILMSLERSRTVWDFAVGRFARLYPGYWVSLVVAGIYTWAAGIFHLPLFIVSTTMLQSYWDLPNIVVSYWTLEYELWFYFVMALIFAGGQLHNTAKFALVWLLVAFALRSGDALVWGDQIQLRGDINLVRILRPDYGHFFIIGMMLYRLQQGYRDHLTVSVLVLAISYSLFGLDTWIALPSTVYFPVTFAFAAIVWASVSGMLPVMENRVLIALGSWSYAIYLLHLPIGLLFNLLAEQLSLPASIAIAFATPVSIGLAALATRYVERPAQIWLKNVLQSRGRATELTPVKD